MGVVLLATDRSHVAVVINDNSPLSRRLGAFYASWHELEASQICHITTKTEETIDRRGYEVTIAGPIAKCLTAARRVESTYYVVTTQGMPIRVSDVENHGASVDSELAMLYSEMHGRKTDRNWAVVNPFYRQKDAPFGHPAFPIYLVTRLAGYSFEDARKAVERCRGARNRGRVVLDLKADNDDDGNSWLRTAGILLPADRVVMDTSTTVLTGIADVIGYASWGSNDTRRKSRASGMKWLPGAVATEFVSTNARTLEMPPFQWSLGTWKDRATWFAGSPQSMILDYVYEGVSGISGNVDEPKLSMTVRPDVLMPAYLGGRNLAESFYLALPGLSWHSMILGDPLCHLE